jgi:hypothetical protein
VRFLPEYDNVLLSHADRRRVVPEVHPGLYPADQLGIGHVLVDGRLQATWRLARPKGEAPATVTVRHRAGLPKHDQAAVLAEAHRALPILTQGAPEGHVVLVAADA